MAKARLFGCEGRCLQWHCEREDVFDDLVLERRDSKVGRTRPAREVLAVCVKSMALHPEAHDKLVAYSSASSSSTASGRVAQLVAKRTTVRPSGVRSQKPNDAWRARRSRAASSSTTNCWFVGEARCSS